MIITWICMAFGVIAIILMFCLAYSNDQNNILRKSLEVEIAERDRMQKELNRLKVAMRVDKELYDMDLESMRTEITSFSKNVDKLEMALKAKNAEIIRLKRELKGGN